MHVSLYIGGVAVFSLFTLWHCGCTQNAVPALKYLTQLDITQGTSAEGGSISNWIKALGCMRLLNNAIRSLNLLVRGQYIKDLNMIERDQLCKSGMSQLIDEANERKRAKALRDDKEFVAVSHRNLKTMAYTTFYDHVRISKSK